MNGSLFATSRDAGFLVLWIVGCVVLSGIIVLALLVERREHLRRADRMRLARAQRDARVRAFPVGATLRVVRPSNAGMGDRPAATRARLSGIDELQIENLAMWSERSR